MWVSTISTSNKTPAQVGVQSFSNPGYTLDLSGKVVKCLGSCTSRGGGASVYLKHSPDDFIVQSGMSFTVAVKREHLKKLTAVLGVQRMTEGEC